MYYSIMMQQDYSPWCAACWLEVCIAWTCLLLSAAAEIGKRAENFPMHACSALSATRAQRTRPGAPLGPPYAGTTWTPKHLRRAPATPVRPAMTQGGTGGPGRGRPLSVHSASQRGIAMHPDITHTQNYIVSAVVLPRLDAQ